MLPRAHRMRRRGDFTFAVRRGRRAGRSRLVVHMLRGEKPEETARVGFAVSRTVGNAVVRNRVLRQLRHLMRDRLDRLPAGSLTVIRANPAAAGASSAELAADLDKVLDRVNRVARGAAR